MRRLLASSWWESWSGAALAGRDPALADEPPPVIASRSSGAETLALEVDRQRQQIETLEKTVQALAEQLKSAPPGEPAAAGGIEQATALEQQALQQKPADAALGQELETFRRELEELAGSSSRQGARRTSSALETSGDPV